MPETKNCLTCRYEPDLTQSGISQIARQEHSHDDRR